MDSLPWSQSAHINEVWLYKPIWYSEYSISAENSNRLAVKHDAVLVHGSEMIEQYLISTYTKQ